MCAVIYMHHIRHLQQYLCEDYELDHKYYSMHLRSLAHQMCSHTTEDSYLHMNVKTKCYSSSLVTEASLSNFRCQNN